MAALNKQQARYKQKRTTSYGAEPGEVTRGLKPGARYYDADTNTWQLRPQTGGDMNAMLDEMVDTGMGGKNAKEGPSSSGGAGSSKEAPADAAATEAPSVQTGDDSILEEVIAGLLGGVGGAALTRMLAGRKAGNLKPKSGAGNPATDTAGTADKGGTGTDVVGEQSIERPSRGGLPAEVQQPITDPDGIMDASYTEQGRLNGPQRQLPAPDAEVLPPLNTIRAAKGQQAPSANPDLPPATQGQLPPPMDAGAQSWLDDINRRVSGSSVVDQTMQAVEGPGAPMLSPDVEEAIQALAAQMAARGTNNLDPSLDPGLPNMDPMIMQRLKAILAGGM